MWQIFLENLLMDAALHLFPIFKANYENAPYCVKKTMNDCLTPPEANKKPGENASKKFRALCIAVDPVKLVENLVSSVSISPTLESFIRGVKAVFPVNEKTNGVTFETFLERYLEQHPLQFRIPELASVHSLESISYINDLFYGLRCLVAHRRSRPTWEHTLSQFYDPNIARPRWPQQPFDRLGSPHSEFFHTTFNFCVSLSAEENAIQRSKVPMNQTTAAVSFFASLGKTLEGALQQWLLYQAKVPIWHISLHSWLLCDLMEDEYSSQSIELASLGTLMSLPSLRLPKIKNLGGKWLACVNEAVGAGYLTCTPEDKQHYIALASYRRSSYDRAPDTSESGSAMAFLYQQ